MGDFSTVAAALTSLLQCALQRCFAEVLCCVRALDVVAAWFFSYGIVRARASVEKCMFVYVCVCVACKAGCVFVCLLIFDIDAL